MESIQQIKNRINSIASTRQITQSMHLVSSSKIVKSRNKLVANQDFFTQANDLIEAVRSSPDIQSHPYIVGFDAKDAPKRDAVVIVLSSDRGLCGGYNVSVCRESFLLVKKLKDVRVITVGVKGREYFKRRRPDCIAKSFIGVSENPFYEDAQEVASMVLDWYNNGEVSEIYLIYTKFVNMLSQTPDVKKLLPLDPYQPEEHVKKDKTENKMRTLVRLEPDDTTLLINTVPFYLNSFIFRAMLEASVCEQSARVAGMDSAVKNADEMMESLTLKYNQARQSAITQEVIEIISGAKAVQK